MASPSKSSPLSVLEAPSELVRRFSGSSVVGLHKQSSSLDLQRDCPQVISCDFEMKIPKIALRIDISISVSSRSNGCEDDPSVAYKITICTPRHAQQTTADDDCIRRVTTTTLRWSSKFTVAKGNENQSPYHHWSGSFELGEKKCTDLSECYFHQVEGIFRSNFEEHRDRVIPMTALSLGVSSINEQKLKRNIAENDDSHTLHRTTKKRRRTLRSFDPTLENQIRQTQDSVLT